VRALAAALAVLALSAGAAVAATGQSPDCRRYCMSVEPRSGPEGSVFRFTGRGWRPERLVRVNFGAYCRPDQACIDILYTALLPTDGSGRFTFRLRAGRERPRDAGRGIRSGGRPTFLRRVRGVTVSRRPRYTVVLPGG
jgi:hypothetical protein